MYKGIASSLKVAALKNQLTAASVTVLVSSFYKKLVIFDLSELSLTIKDVIFKVYLI